MLQTQILKSVTDLDRPDWDRLFPGRVEGWDYFRACEAAAPQGFELGALAVYRDGALVGAAPTFKVNYRLDMSLPQRFQAIGEWLNARAPRLVNAPVVGLGSPLVEECPIGIDARLSRRIVRPSSRRCSPRLPSTARLPAPPCWHLRT